MLGALILISFFKDVFSLSVAIDKKETCFQVNAKTKQKLTITYVVSGMTEDRMAMSLLDDYNKILLYVDRKREGNFEYTLVQAGPYRICFRSQDNNYKHISFDFELEGQEKNIASSDSMLEITEKLRLAYQEMVKVFRNQHFQSDRETIHEKLFEQTDNHIKVCSCVKILVVILISFLQVFLLKRYFNDKFIGPSV